MASSLCQDLNGELVSLDETYSTPTQVRKYARAIAEQKMSMRQLRNSMREEGCSGGSIFILGGDNADACSEHEAKMARMEANLSILNDKRMSLLTGQDSAARRQRVIAAIEQNGCNDQPVLASTDPSDDDDPEPFATDMPDGRETIRVPESTDGYGSNQFIDLGGAATSGSYRTMCVRTCDGAYFPISSQASTLSFGRDAQVCSMMCPGMETELFYHSIRQETDAMRSVVTGRLYGQLDNAYRFRTTDAGEDKPCSCNFSLYYREMMRREAHVADPGKRQAKQSSIVWVKPQLRGQLSKEVAAAKPVKQPALRDYKPDARIRMIGPMFLPDEGTMDLHNPRPVVQD